MCYGRNVYINYDTSRMENHSHVPIDALARSLRECTRNKSRRVLRTAEYGRARDCVRFARLYVSAITYGSRRVIFRMETSDAIKTDVSHLCVSQRASNTLPRSWPHSIVSFYYIFPPPPPTRRILRRNKRETLLPWIATRNPSSILREDIHGRIVVKAEHAWIIIDVTAAIININNIPFTN